VTPHRGKICRVNLAATAMFAARDLPQIDPRH
jgi:hypothetical protein